MHLRARVGRLQGNQAYQYGLYLYASVGPLADRMIALELQNSPHLVAAIDASYAVACI